MNEKSDTPHPGNATLKYHHALLLHRCTLGPFLLIEQVRSLAASRAEKGHRTYALARQSALPSAVRLEQWNLLIQLQCPVSDPSFNYSLTSARIFIRPLFFPFVAPRINKSQPWSSIYFIDLLTLQLICLPQIKYLFLKFLNLNKTAKNAILDFLKWKFDWKNKYFCWCEKWKKLKVASTNVVL